MTRSSDDARTSTRDTSLDNSSRKAIFGCLLAHSFRRRKFASTHDHLPTGLQDQFLPRPLSPTLTWSLPAMNTRPAIDESTGPIALNVGFNQDSSCFAVGLDTGFCGSCSTIYPFAWASD